MLAATVRTTGDFDVAQDCAQEAFVAALRQWPAIGVPTKPGAWLVTVARRRALDSLRRDRTLQTKLKLLMDDVETPSEWLNADAADDAVADTIEDDPLRLVFICAHPALALPARVALTLRLVAGLSTAEVARALLVSEATAAARITRAKKKIAEARIPYRTPTAADLPERLDSVLTTVHLLFSTGHTAPTGEQLVRDDLCERALGRAHTLVQLLPAAREARGLLGLLLLTHARRAARLDAQGRLVLLEHQDRQQWDHVMIVEGLRWTVESLQAPQPGRFALQAAIAGAHAVAPTFGATDWARVVHLYDLLLAVEPSPVVELNRAAALAFAEGPAAALAIVERLAGDPRLRSYPYVHAVRADLLRRLGRAGEATTAYRAALDLTANGAERDFLRRRISDLDPVAATRAPNR